MNSILASNLIKEQRGGFWARQFDASPTSGQVVFDVVFGLLMPLFCFYLDPGIVRGGFSTPLGELNIFIYAFSGIAISALSIWLVFGQRMRSLTVGLGGVLLAGAVISASIGVMILPLTLIGILFVIGLLGLVPFITGFVYLRNGMRAIAPSNPAASRWPRVAVAVFSALIAIGLPATAQWRVTEAVKQSITEILDENSVSIDVPVARIKRLHLVVDIDRIVGEYEKETNTVRKERLARAYNGITGEEIETRLRILKD